MKYTPKFLNKMIRMHIDWHLSHRGLKPDLQQFRKSSER